MDELDPDVARSLRGSAARDSILLSADGRKRAYLAQLAQDAGVDIRTAKEAILGGPPRFAPDLALARLSLLRPIDDRFVEFEITPRGVEQAKIRRTKADRRRL